VDKALNRPFSGVKIARKEKCTTRWVNFSGMIIRGVPKTFAIRERGKRRKPRIWLGQGLIRFFTLGKQARTSDVGAT